MRWGLLVALGAVGCELEVEALGPTQGPPDTPAAPQCARTPTLDRQGTINVSTPLAAPVVGDGLVHWVVAQPSDGDSEIFVLDVLTGKEELLTDNTGHDTAIDAAGSALLANIHANGSRLYYRDAVESIELDGEVQFPTFGWRPRSVAPRRALWVRDGMMRFWVDGQLEQWPVSSDDALGDFEDDTVVWMASDGRDLEIFLKPPGAPPRRITDNRVDDRAPVIPGSSILWLQEGALMLAHTAGSTVTTLHEGPCLPAASDGGRALIACGGSGGLPASMNQLLLFEGGLLRELPRTRGGAAFSPRLQGPYAAWIEYDLDADLCNRAVEDVGSIVVLDLDAPDAVPLPITRVGTTCWCCSAWPLPAIDFDGRTLAWNYALQAHSQPGAALGYVVLGPTGQCP